MKIKLVICDLDGTLIAKDEKISDFIPDMISALNAKGIGFAIATGRTPYLANGIVGELGIVNPCVMSNGAAIVQNGKVLESRFAPINPIKPVINHAAECGMSVILGGAEKDTIFRKTPWLEQQYELFGRYDMVYEPREEEWESLEFSKLTIWDKTKEIERIADKLFEQFGTMFSITKYDSSCVEIVPYGVNKQTGIELLAKRLKVGPDEIMAIGDHYNDLEMIAGAGIGVAMGSSPEELKRRADYICEKPLAYGVLDAVKKFCL